MKMQDRLLIVLVRWLLPLAIVVSGLFIWTMIWLINIVIGG
jgi:hypothetical protein